MRMRRFLALHEVAASEGKKAGVDSALWLPPEVEKKFGDQLATLGLGKVHLADIRKMSLKGGHIARGTTKTTNRQADKLIKPAANTG